MRSTLPFSGLTAAVLTTVVTLATTTEASAVPRFEAFGADSVWKADVSSAPLNPNSAALVTNLVGQVAANYGTAAFNVNTYGTSIYTVPADQPLIDVTWVDCQRKGKAPAGLLGEGGQFTAVPIPADAVPAAGTDGQLTIHSPSTDTLWEFWKAKRVNGQWTACWGGRLDDVSTSEGYFEGWWGASASGLAVSGGSVLIQDAQAGVIDHALSLQIPNVQDKAVFSWPAQRSDGSDLTPNAIPEGLRFRLDPAVNVEALNLTPIAKMVARSAQKQGFIVTDRAGAVAVVAESPSAVTAATGINPWTALMKGKKSYEIFKNFPWDKMQALPMDYGEPQVP